MLHLLPMPHGTGDFADEGLVLAIGYLLPLHLRGNRILSFFYLQCAAKVAHLLNLLIKYWKTSLPPVMSAFIHWLMTLSLWRRPLGFLFPFTRACFSILSNIWWYSSRLLSLRRLTRCRRRLGKIRFFKSWVFTRRFSIAIIVLVGRVVVVRLIPAIICVTSIIGYTHFIWHFVSSSKMGHIWWNLPPSWAIDGEFKRPIAHCISCTWFRCR